MRISKATKTDVKASISDFEYEVQGNYGYGWDLLTTEDTREAAEEQKKCYDENEPNVPHRIKRVRTGSVDACDDVKGCNASTSTDKALQHIKAAIDILGKSGSKDAVTKDSIANLGVVLFDLKSKQ